MAEPDAWRTMDRLAPHDHRWPAAGVWPAPRQALRFRLRRWSWLLAPITVGVVSRAYASGLVQLASLTDPAYPPQLVPAASPFVQWDGQWYLSIAERGYHAAALQGGGLVGRHDFAFFPLWPVTIDLASLGLLPLATVAFVAANLLFVLAAIVVWRLLADVYGPEVATGGLALMAFSPAAYAFSLGYSESLFLLIAAVGLAAGRAPGRRLLTTGLAMLTRIAGVGLIVASVVRALQAQGEEGRAERRVALAAAAVGIIAFGAWWTYIAFLTGDPMGFMRGAPDWSRSSGLAALGKALADPRPQQIADLAVPAVVLIGALLAWRRNAELGSYALTVALLGTLPGGGISSMPRYVLVAFPAYAGLAERLGRNGTLILLFLCAVAEWYFIGWSFTGFLAMPP